MVKTKKDLKRFVTTQFEKEMMLIAIDMATSCLEHKPFNHYILNTISQMITVMFGNDNYSVRNKANRFDRTIVMCFAQIDFEELFNKIALAVGEQVKFKGFWFTKRCYINDVEIQTKEDLIQQLLLLPVVCEQVKFIIENNMKDKLIFNYQTAKPIFLM